MTGSRERLYRTAIAWGALLLLLTLAWMAFERLMGWHGAQIADHARYSTLYDAVFAGTYAAAFWAQRQRAEPGAFPWMTGFLFGLGITVVITGLSPLTQVITHRLISPEFFHNVIRFAVDNGVLTEAEARARYNLGTYIWQNLAGTFLLGILCSILFAYLLRK